VKLGPAHQDTRVGGQTCRPNGVWRLQDISLLWVVSARVNRPFIPHAHLYCLHCCNTTARLLGIIRTPTPLSTSLVYAIHHTILVIAISCEGQNGVRIDRVPNSLRIVRTQGGARNRPTPQAKNGPSPSVKPMYICSADGSTHTESNKLYRKVKDRARPNLSPGQRPKRAPIRRHSRRRQRRGEPHTEHGLGVLYSYACMYTECLERDKQLWSPLALRSSG